MEQKVYIQQDQGWLEIAKIAWEARRLRMFYEKSEKRAFEQLKKLSNDNPSIAGDFIFDNFERLGTIDYTAIPELQDVNLEQYRKDVVTIWKLKKTINIPTEE